MDFFKDSTMAAGLALAFSQTTEDTDKLTDMTEAEKEELLNNAKDEKPEDKDSGYKLQ